MRRMEQQFEASIRIRAPIGIAADVLVTDADSVVAERRHRHPDIEVMATTDRRRGLTVEFSPAHAGPDEASLPIRWAVARDGQPASSFAGELEVRGDHPGSRLTLRGTYTVGASTPAARGDDMHVAERALTAFLSQAARRLDSEVDRRRSSIAWHPAPYPDTLRPTGSENFIG